MATVIARIERGVLAGGDGDAVRVPHAEPLLRDRRDRVAVALDLVLVVDDVALRLHVRTVLDVDREAISDADQRLVDGRDRVAAALDCDLVANAELALLNPDQLLPRGTLDNEGARACEAPFR